MKLFTKNTILYDYILFGLYLFYTGMMLHDYVFIEAKWTRIISMCGIGFVSWGFLKLHKTFQGCDFEAIALLRILFLVCFVNIILGILLYSGQVNVGFMIFNPQYFWIYFVPFFFLLPCDVCNIRQLFRWSLVYVLSALLFSLYCFNDFFYNADFLRLTMLSFDPYIINRPQEPAALMTPIAAFLLLFPHFQKRWKLIVVITAVLALGAPMMMGRRSASAIFLGYLIIPFIFYLFGRRKRLLFFGIMIIIFISMISIRGVENLVENYFPVLTDRLDQDTRSGTEADFYKDMDGVADWTFGRGMHGTYRSPAVADTDRLNRYVIETGYLNIILHGGLLMLIPYVLLLLFASYKGFFHSNNMYVKGCAAYVLYHLIILYPDGTPKFTLEYLILFAMIRICLSMDWRDKSGVHIVR